MNNESLEISDTSVQTFRELVRRRYGAAAPEVLLHSPASEGALDELFAHKSVRAFADRPLVEGTVEALAAAAQSASSSSNLQTWSVVAIQDPERKSRAATLCANQEFIRRAPLFFVFVADLARLTWVSEQESSPAEGLDYFETFLLAAIDATLAAQNAAVAAEKLGLGICYVGGARNHPRELAELLHLPPRTIGLFGMAVGWPAPALTTTVKPRLPQPGLLHYETYDDVAWEEELRQYNQIMNGFFAEQGLVDHPSWSKTSAQRVASKKSLAGRHVLREILEERGFGLK